MVTPAEAARLDAIEGRLQVLELAEARRRLSRRDRRVLERLLPVIVAVKGSDLFTTRELREAEAAGLRLVLDGLSPEALGRLLARAVGVPLSGLLVERVGAEHSAVVWRVVGAV